MFQVIIFGGKVEEIMVQDELRRDEETFIAKGKDKQSLDDRIWEEVALLDWSPRHKFLKVKSWSTLKYNRYSHVFNLCVTSERLMLMGSTNAPLKTMSWNVWDPCENGVLRCGCCYRFLFFTKQWLAHAQIVSGQLTISICFTLAASWRFVVVWVHKNELLLVCQIRYYQVTVESSVDKMSLMAFCLFFSYSRWWLLYRWRITKAGISDSSE